MKDKFTQFKDKLLTEIESGSVAIEPRWKTLLPKALVAGLIGLAFVLTVLLFSYILFAIRAAGVSALLGFGGRGFVFFLTFFPWSILALDVVLIILVGILAKRFAFGWKTPRLYLLLGLLIAAFAAGAVVDRPLNNTISNHRNILPTPVGNWYDTPPPRDGGGFTRGMILHIEGDRMTLVDARSGELIDVRLDSERVKAAAETMTTGEWIVVAGDEIDDVIEAFGIRHFTPNF